MGTQKVNSSIRSPEDKENKMGLLLMLADLICSEDGSVLEGRVLVSTQPNVYDNCNLSPQMLNSC